METQFCVELSRITRGHKFLRVQLGYSSTHEVSAGAFSRLGNGIGEEIKITRERAENDRKLSVC